MISIEQFILLLRDELVLGINCDVTADARIIADLDFDSLQLMLLAGWLEDCFGVPWPVQFDMRDANVRDLHHLASLRDPGTQ